MSAAPAAILDQTDPVGSFGAVARSGGSLALPTSGSTGVQRTVVRTARSWTEAFPIVAELTGLTSRSRIWIPGPLAATMNLFAAVHADWVGAQRVDFIDSATHVQLTPSLLRRLIDDQVDLAGRTLVVAGDTLDPVLRQRAEAVGARVEHYYGAAELSFVAWGVDRDRLRPFPGVEVRVIDGEIWVRSPYLADGYLGHGDGPLRRDPDGRATVGDRGRWEGQRLVVLGRPDAIGTAGATVLVADVEAAIRPHLRGQVVILGLPHPRFGEIVAAVLTDAADRDRARTAAIGLGPGRPRRWFTVPELPLTDVHKVDRHRLASWLASGSTDSGSEP
jgi:long-chain acyl-CoA synthetase